MSHSFDPYEYIAVIAPGSVVTLGICAEWPTLKSFLEAEGFSLGDLGIALVAAFVVGHLVQAVGNLLEALLWMPFGGMPTVSITQPGALLSPAQRRLVEERLSRLKQGPVDLDRIERRELKRTVPQIFSQVRAAGRADRIDVWNRNYGLMRGISAAFLLLALWLLFKKSPDFEPAALAASGAAVAWLRAFRFARYYARDLFIEWIGLPALTPPPLVPSAT